MRQNKKLIAATDLERLIFQLSVKNTLCEFQDLVKFDGFTIC